MTAAIEIWQTGLKMKWRKLSQEIKKNGKWGGVGMTKLKDRDRREYT